MQKSFSSLVKFNYKYEIVIFLILFLASTSIAIFQYLEWEDGDERIKHNAMALFTGDEPFYLEVVSSIANFQSLSTSAHFTSLEKDPFLSLPPVFYEVHSCRLHHSLTAADGECYLPGVGFPIILSPAYVIFGFVGSMSTISFLFAFQGIILYKISNKFTSKKLGFFLTLLVSFSTILFSFSTEIYPDFVGGFFVLLIFYFFYFRQTTFFNLVIVGLSLGFLPILKSYFVLFPVLLLPIMIFVLFRKRCYNNIIHLSASFLIMILVFFSISVFIAPIEVSRGLGGGYTSHVVNTVSNSGMTQSSTGEMEVYQLHSGYIEFIESIGIGFQSLLFDQANGLFAFSPIVLVAAFGIKYVWKTDKYLALSISMSVLLFLASFAFFSPFAGGWSLPSRNLLPILPIFLILFFPIFERFKKNISFHFIILISVYIVISLNIIFVRRIFGHFTISEREDILSRVYYGFSQHFPSLVYDPILPHPSFYEHIHPLFTAFTIFIFTFIIFFTFSKHIKNIFKSRNKKIIFSLVLTLIFVPTSYFIVNSYNEVTVEDRISKIYDEILQRPPSADEILSAKNYFVNDEITLEELKILLSNSDEGKIVNEISKIYQEILQREPDSSGLNHWKEKIINNEISFKELETIIRNSAEGIKNNAN